MSGMHVLNFEKSVYLMINARVSYTTISLLLDPNNTLHSSRNSLQNFRVNAQKKEKTSRIQHVAFIHATHVYRFANNKNRGKKR
jgi:hypothetical protein